MNLYSDRLARTQEATETVIDDRTWRAIHDTIYWFVQREGFPDYLRLAGGTYSTSRDPETDTLRLAEDADLMVHGIGHEVWYQRQSGRKMETPRRDDIFDLLEFCHKSTKRVDDRKIGTRVFRDQVNAILRRNLICFQINEQGEVTRTTSIVFQEMVGEFDKGTQGLEGEVRRLIEQGIGGYIGRRDENLEVGIKALWSAWERLKTTFQGADKRRQTQDMVNVAAQNETPELRKLIDDEAKILTDAGNQFTIRHSETDRIAVRGDSQQRWLFERLFALILLIAKGQAEGKR